jgi:tetratricopeptide (TPR) repeat protein
LELLDNERDSDNYLDLTGLNHYNLFLAYGIEEGQKYAELALAEFELFLKRNPNHEETYKFFCCLADLYLWLEQYDNALEFHGKAFEISEDIDWKVSSLSGMGRVCISKGEFANAETYLKQALMIADNNVSLLSSLYYNMGETYYHSKRFNEALAAFQKALQYRDDDTGLRYDNEYLADILRHLGDLAYDSEDYDKAIDYFVMTLESIGKENIHYCNCHIILGHCYLIKEDYANAREHYNMVLLSTHAREEELEVVRESLSRCPLDS